jgi:hypothetical protein
MATLSMLPKWMQGGGGMQSVGSSIRELEVRIADIHAFRTATATLPAHPLPRPITLEAEFGAAERAEYARVTAKLGIASPAFTKLETEHVLSELGIEVFDWEEVREFLDKAFPTRWSDSGATRTGGWEWKPLQAVHATARFEAYPKAIPLPILLLVERVADRLPEAVFFVSDEKSPQDFLDPFLMMRHGGNVWVIACWDEPGFTGKAEPTAPGPVTPK